MSGGEDLINTCAGDKTPSGKGSSDSPAGIPDRRIGPFRIEGELGRGGMGVVYMAHDTDLDRPVALKSLPAELTKDARALSRLQHEARVLASLNHPNIATIYEKVERTEVGCYLVLEYVPGETLGERISRGKLNLKEALRIGLQIADTLSAAHSKDIVHHDLNPKNIKITPDGSVKILDFGLAKSTGRPAHDRDFNTSRGGAVVGTPPYMSPEKLRGDATDHRGDIWSFGCLLYEMLSGVRPFPGASTSAVLTAVVIADPDLERVPPEAPAAVREVIGKCLERNPEKRYQSAGELLQDLSDSLSALTAPADDLKALSRFLKRPYVAFPLALAVLGLCTFALWFSHRTVKLRWARSKALPEIARLIEQDKYFEAFTLAREAEKYMPNDPMLLELWPRMSRDCFVTTAPTGADIFLSGYSAVDTQWEHLGRSPLGTVRVPLGMCRWRIEKGGFGTLEIVRANWPSAPWGRPGAGPVARLNFALHREGSAPSGMVWIPPSQLESRLWPLRFFARISAPAYSIDKYEVTNRQFKDFVEKGGYRNPKYWEELRFVRGGRGLSWAQAMSEFCDSTGQPGPSTWEEGTYAKGQGDYPVSGVSWFEASAYAKFRGKCLPTVYHWIKAAVADDDPSQIIRFSNFGDGPAPAGNHKGMGQFGLYDAAGNVREWCYNATDDSKGSRYCLGGAWGEPAYMFVCAEARCPWDRNQANGFRCVQYTGGREAVPQAAFGPIDRNTRDFAQFTPVSDDTFQSYIQNLYEYDRTELHAVIESLDESSEHWRLEKVTFDAAYSKERVIAYLFLPRGIDSPYQTVVFFPGAGVIHQHSSEELRYGPVIVSVIRSGRALVYPIYKGTYERRTEDIIGLREAPITISYRDWTVQLSKDLRRSIDYLETRDDIDIGKLAYFGLSWGAALGPIMMATEDRFKAGIFLIGGLYSGERHPAADAANFAPRVKVPTLMINGRDDYFFPYEMSQKPLFNLLGTPLGKKRHIVYPGGHSATWEYRPKCQKNILDWLDHYLGPVANQP
ncbi:MAG: protein kinase domain-containing protein [Planctomycetota bacterium]|jgi:serine/threonine protein kinase/dienelactone hydrolase